MKTRRPGISMFDLLAVLAFLGMLAALLLPAIAKVQDAAKRAESMNNVKQLALAIHNSADFNRGTLPSGVDAKGFSTATYLLPYIEQENLYKQIDFTKSMDDKANAAVRAARVKIFVSPRDGIASVNAKYGATNYLFCAGAEPALKNNNGVFYSMSRSRMPASFPDGTSNTVIVGETLKGDGAARAVTPLRQYVSLTKADLAKLKPNAGSADFKANKNIAANRGASWMDGRFLQGTFTATLKINDPNPDVDCDGIGGYSSLRMTRGMPIVGMGDGSVRILNPKMSMQTWRAACTRADAEVLGADW